jgi:hypothetical protein
MNKVLIYLSSHVRPGAFVGLMTAEGSSKFYEKYGFIERPLGRPGMFQIWAYNEACRKPAKIIF